MIWVYFVFLIGTIAWWPKLLRDKSYRAFGLQCVLIFIAGIMSVLVQTHIWETIDPLKPITVIFKPLTQMINHIL